MATESSDRGLGAASAAAGSPANARGKPPTTPRLWTVEVRPAERTLLVDGKPAELGARAFDVLLALIAHQDRVVTKDELLDMV